MHADVVDGPEFESDDDAGRRDPGPTTLQLQVHAGSVDEARQWVQAVLDGHFPPGMVLLGEPTKA